MARLKRERQATRFFSSDKRKPVGRNEPAPRVRPRTRFRLKRACRHADAHDGNVTTQVCTKCAGVPCTRAPGFEFLHYLGCVWMLVFVYVSPFQFLWH